MFVLNICIYSHVYMHVYVCVYVKLRPHGQSLLGCMHMDCGMKCHVLCDNWSGHFW